MEITTLMPAKLANSILNMQMEHSLPIEITIGPKADDMVLTKIACNKEDEKALLWVLEKSLFESLKDILQ